jgi:hypothetical protein
MTNLIYYEHIIESSLFNKIFMQRSMFYIYDKKNWIAKHVIPVYIS